MAEACWLVVGMVGVLVCIAGAVISREQFLRGYLIAYMFWLGLSLGCLALLMVQYLSGGFWGLCDSQHAGSGEQRSAADGVSCSCRSCSAATIFTPG